MFKTSYGSGFQMTFANGWTVSVQFGRFSYCENRDYNINHYNTFEKGECANAEIAAFNKSGVWHNFGDDEVRGWVNPDDVAEFIAMIKAK